MKFNSKYLTEQAQRPKYTPQQVQKTVDQVKKQLIQRWKNKGGYENFGDKEARQLHDKFNTNPYGSSEERSIHAIIQKFDDWAMNYDGQSESI